MLREGITHALTWADKTMSVIRTRQLEACEQRLLRLPTASIFSDQSETLAESLWRISNDGQEHPRQQRLHTAAELRAELIIQLPAEAALLTFQEEQLVERLLSLGGQCELMDWDEVDAAESLVRRLWCTISQQEDRIQLHLPQELMTPLMLVTSSRQHTELRAQLMECTTQIRAMLYLNGLLCSSQAMSLLRETVLHGTYADDETLALRYLRNAFDYVYDPSGEMLLLHPGLADPDRLLHGRRADVAGQFTRMLDEEQYRQAAAGMLLEEMPSYNMMLGLLQEAVRPELSPEDAVEDLRMLAKQGVSLHGMCEVLSSMLIMQPTAAMLQGVRLLHDLTPRWGTMRAGVMM